MRSSRTEVLAGHLNAPSGPLITAADITRALRNGSAEHLKSNSAGRAALLSMFIEAEPSLILACVREANADWRSADALYRQALADGLPRVPRWESVVTSWQ
jgi:hypothetical protein